MQTICDFNIMNYCFFNSQVNLYTLNYNTKIIHPVKPFYLANCGPKGDWVFKIAELSATCVKMKKFSVSFGIKVHVI